VTASADNPVETDAPAANARFGGASAILVATVIAGGLTYLLQAIVLAALSDVAYLQYSIVWSVLYLVVGALAGIQQEVSRATVVVAPGASRAGGSVTARFALVAAGVAFVVFVVAGVFWAPQTIQTDPIAIVVLVGAGAASYVFVAALSGTLYGLHRWIVLAWMIAIDAVLRAVFIAAAAWSGAPLLVLVVAMVLPFPLSIAATWLIVRSSVRGRTRLDVGFRGLAWNASRTVIGSAATAIMVSGFPFLLGVTSPGQPVAAAAVIAVVTLTRAPLVIPVLAMQSFLVVYFRDHAGRLGRSLLVILGGVALVTVVASLLAWWIGPEVLHWFGKDFPISSWEIALIVASAGATAALCVTGPATLARNDHLGFTTGWVVAALLVIGALLLPLDPAGKSVIALCVGPLVGLLTHLASLARRPGSRPSAA
jgi:O-antigen/teichoic acid export membrane protein